ncbi:hypothetical protein MM239_09980 [Belliella sp. DSM 111904]|uniref:Uncharacterized protein n=1 Tax=Belliella filtrata TaxID=2923435 RepID=A0ABS9V062_9BACT|nr:hypothetical protein [Belliella filtrata]MCH7409723.1 hypothetical protein [Belliella filtrata]
MRISADNLIVDNVDDLRITASGQAAEGTRLTGQAPLWAPGNLVFGDLD